MIFCRLSALYGQNICKDIKKCRNISPARDVCRCGYISKDTLDKCPKCGSDKLDYLTRVIGYLKRVSSFSEIRQEEASHRYYNPDGPQQ